MTIAADQRYAEAISAYGVALERVARGYEADSDRRRDLLQDIRLALWRRFETFRDQCSVRTWVYRVAHNVWLTRHTDPRALPAGDIRHAAGSLQRRGRRDFILCTVAAVLAVARGAWALAEDDGVRMLAGVVLAVTAIGYLYWMSRTYVASGG